MHEKISLFSSPCVIRIYLGTAYSHEMDRGGWGELVCLHPVVFCRIDECKLCVELPWYGFDPYCHSHIQKISQNERTFSRSHRHTNSRAAQSPSAADAGFVNLLCTFMKYQFFSVFFRSWPVREVVQFSLSFCRTLIFFQGVSHIFTHPAVLLGAETDGRQSCESERARGLQHDS